MRKHVNVITVIFVLLALASFAAAAKGHIGTTPQLKGFFGGG